MECQKELRAPKANGVGALLRMLAPTLPLPTTTVAFASNWIFVSARNGRQPLEKWRPFARQLALSASLSDDLGRTKASNPDDRFRDVRSKIVGTFAGSLRFY